MSKTAHIKELADKIIKARNDYYNHQSTCSDVVFDAWVDELTKLDPDNKAVTAIGAPVAVNEWEKVAHDIPMSSLNKVNTPDELRAWVKECSAHEVFMTEKLDGLSINTIWEKGLLVKALTRGDGSIGENITINVGRMKGIPKKLKKSFTGSLRGEIILRKSDHKKHFSEYSNPRNAASGIAKRYDSEGSEHLSVLMYQASVEDFNTEKEQFLYLTSLGVEVPHYNVYKNVDDAIKEWKRYQDDVRESLDYEIDGLVCRVNKMNDQLALGEKNHRPKGAIAFKFAAETRETTLRNIVWQVGNTGRLTPVGIIDPVEICGATIERASLHNAKRVQELKLWKNCKVLISRRNDVIPFIEGNISENVYVE